MTREKAKAILEEVKVLDDSMYQYNETYLQALDMAIEALDGSDYMEKLIGWVRDNATDSEYIGELCDTLHIPLWWFEQFG